MAICKPIPTLSPVQIEQFWSKVPIDMHDTDSCWPWQGIANSDGYPRWSIYYAHRVAYVLTNGPIQDGLTIDHSCRNRRCCNPRHLQVVSIAENLKRRVYGERKYQDKRRRTPGRLKQARALGS